jgi:L-threonylcarbamoyladenylate synthase
MIGTNIQFAKELLSKGEVVAIPTETVYGLAGNAFDKNAVTKIFEIKNRPFFNPLIVHCKNLEYIHFISKDIDERLMLLMKKFSPGPLTILVDKKDIIPDLVTAGHSRVAVRIPNHPLTLNLLNILDFPLAAPSANPFQYISPTSAKQVYEQLGKKIPYILDGGKCTVGIESTIVGVEQNQIVVYRLGGLSIEDIEEVVGNVKLSQKDIVDDDKLAKEAPGQYKKHYSPKKPFIVGNLIELIQQNKDKKIFAITFGNKDLSGYSNVQECNLSIKADLKEATMNLFEYLYKADNSDADIIIAEYLPDIGLGRAINDRLRRAMER